jgi:hypothetical protein
MKRIISCSECGFDFDLFSVEKRKVGGKSIHCPDCSEEHTVKYAGVQSADGKSAQATILKFNSEEDRKSYISFWQTTSGLHKGKSCQLSKSAPTTPGISFKTISAFTPSNHKGKA